jgi:hypothetical protein
MWGRRPQEFAAEFDAFLGNERRSRQIVFAIGGAVGFAAREAKVGRSGRPRHQGRHREELRDR